MEAPGDSDLIARACAGDKTAFEQLLRPVFDSAARLAYGMLQDRSAAEDAVQESAFRAWRRLGNIRAGADFGPWFFGIVTNQCRSVRRAGSWYVLRLEHEETSARLAPEEVAIRGADLRHALLRLPTDQRAAILLHFYLDLPLEGVAVALGISFAGVKSRINRGLKRMRPALRTYELV